MKTSKFFFSTLIAASAMTATAYSEGEVISLNFTNGDTGKITETATGEAGLVSVGSAGWVNISSAGDTTLETGETVSTTYATGTWQSETGSPSTVGELLLKGYIDVPNHTEANWKVGVSNISYLSYDVYAYFAGDTGGNPKFASISVNGQSYIGDEVNGSVAVSNPTGWGSLNNTATTLQLGVNALKVSDVVSSNVVLTSDWVSGSTRATLAGIQIVNTYTGTATSVNLDGTGMDWTSSKIGSTDWTNSTAETGTYAAFNLTVDTTVSVSEEGITTDAITASGSGALTLSGNAITLIGPGVVRTDSDTASIVVNNNLTFSNGGLISGNVTFGDNAKITIASGILDLGSGHGAIGSAQNPLNLSGSGTLKYSFTTSSQWGGGTDSGIYIADTFSGVIDYTGCLNWSASTTFGGDDVIVKLSSRVGESDAIWGNEAKTFNNKFVFETDYGINLGGSSLTFSGEVEAKKTLNISGSNTLTFSGSATIETLNISGGTVNVNEGKEITVSNLILGSGKGSASGSITGTYKISEGGVFSFYKQSSEVSANLIFEDETKLVLADTNTDSADTGGVYDTSVNSGLKITGGITLNGETTYESPYWKTTEISGKITGEGSINFSGTKNGAWGTNAYLILSNEENDFSGGITIERNTGIVRATSGGALGSGTISLSNSTAILSYLGTAGESFDVISNTITGSGSVYIDSGKVAMIGGNSEFGGNILVNAGVLAAGSVSALGTGAVTVADGATLTIAVSGVASGVVTFNEGSILAIDLNGFVNAVSDGDKMMLSILKSSSITFGSETLTSGTTLTSDLNGYFDATSLGDYATYAREWSYDGNSLSLTLTIPEPSAFGLLAGVGALALVASRRRRSRR